MKKPHSYRLVGGTDLWRRGGEVEVRHGEAAAVWHAPAAPQSHVVDKNQEGHLGSQQSQSQARPHSPGFQKQEDKPPLPLAVKPSGFGAVEETARFSLLKEPTKA